jgi:hypothetical protein
MYGLAELKQAIENPHLVLRELNRAYHRRLYTRPFNTAGMGIFDADWDNMIVLDACRYDTLRDHGDLPVPVDHRVSRGAATPEFVRGNFQNRDLHDVVYVTANTWYFELEDEIDASVHRAIYVEDQAPEATTEEALAAAEEYPNKRLLVHYIPPHHPFEGPTADEYLPSVEEQSNDLFERIQQGDLDVSNDTLRRAYRENLDRVLPEVKTLRTALTGKTVVTADHGELLGDRTRPVPTTDYGHHVGLYDPALVRVPWAVFEDETRKEIVSEQPEEEWKRVEKEVVEQRLEELGYR